MKKSKNKHGETGPIEAKLDTIIQLLENLFILQAANSEIGGDNIRAILSIDMNRISRITRVMK